MAAATRINSLSFDPQSGTLRPIRLSPQEQDVSARSHPVPQLRTCGCSVSVQSVDRPARCTISVRSRDSSSANLFILPRKGSASSRSAPQFRRPRTCQKPLYQRKIGFSTRIAGSRNPPHVIHELRHVHPRLEDERGPLAIASIPTVVNQRGFACPTSPAAGHLCGLMPYGGQPAPLGVPVLNHNGVRVELNGLA